MAIFHLNAKVISRGNGQSAIAAAAYRSGERLRDEQANEQKYYVARAQRILFTAIMGPKDAPKWIYDRNRLWNEVERREARKDSRLAREFEVALPHELTDQQREWLIRDYAREQFVRRGYVVDIAIHAPDETGDGRNFHAHLMVTVRQIGPEGFAPKLDRSLNNREQMEAWRREWAHLTNRHLKRHGHAAQIDHRSLREQGIEREPTVHIGYAAAEMAHRGAQSDRIDELNAVRSRNGMRAEIAALGGMLRALEWPEGFGGRRPEVSELGAAAGMIPDAGIRRKASRGRETDVTADGAKRIRAAAKVGAPTKRGPRKSHADKRPDLEIDREG